MYRIAILSFILILLDSYVYKGIYLLISNKPNSWRYFIIISYWLVSLLLIFQLVTIFTHLDEFRIDRPESFRFWSGVFFVVFFSKLAFIAFHVMDDIYWIFRKITTFFISNPQNIEGTPITRSTFITQLGLVVSAFFLSSFTYGVVKGRYAFQILTEKIKFPNLPKAFNGFRIVQISDLHLGSFVNDFEDIIPAIKMINDLKPDLIVFTGDMVNIHADEAEPWVAIFSKLEASYGKYSIFGNHDYCDYGTYSTQEKEKSIKRLKEIHHEMGFTLLEDEHTFVEKDNQKFALLGMHNWGKDFHRVGDLNKTMKGLSDDFFKILLSHDPSLWEEEVKNQKNIDLTLSGHTHGMQMGVEIPSLNLKWSPVKWRYQHWAGLYNVGKNYIYINRGFGFLGYPGRVGIKPEITLIELESESLDDA